jgi:hypothetical protein
MDQYIYSVHMQDLENNQSLKYILVCNLHKDFRNNQQCIYKILLHFFEHIQHWNRMEMVHMDLSVLLVWIEEYIEQKHCQYVYRDKCKKQYEH